jgi:hypothetical protein
LFCLTDTYNVRHILYIVSFPANQHAQKMVFGLAPLNPGPEAKKCKYFYNKPAPRLEKGTPDLYLRRYFL